MFIAFRKPESEIDTAKNEYELLNMVDDGRLPKFALSYKYGAKKCIPTQWFFIVCRHSLSRVKKDIGQNIDGIK
jgi:hypothetical protein